MINTTSTQSATSAAQKSDRLAFIAGLSIAVPALCLCVQSALLPVFTPSLLAVSAALIPGAASAFNFDFSPFLNRARKSAAIAAAKANAAATTHSESEQRNAAQVETFRAYLMEAHHMTAEQIESEIGAIMGRINTSA